MSSRIRIQYIYYCFTNACDATDNLPKHEKTNDNNDGVDPLNDGVAKQDLEVKP